MELNIKQLLKVLLAGVLIFFLLIIGVWLLHLYIPEYWYDILFYTSLCLFFAIGLICVSGFAYFIYVYRHGEIIFIKPKVFFFLIGSLYPVILKIGEIIDFPKHLIQRFFIELNNICIRSMKLKVSPWDILILVPHCLQNSKCTVKVTTDPTTCKMCGGCKIEGIVRLHQKYKIPLTVATGGTLARKKIRQYNPKFIISVACERDLISGIRDVKKIPVFGVLNQRPKGPCADTTVDLNKLEQAILDFIDA